MHDENLPTMGGGGTAVVTPCCGGRRHTCCVGSFGRAVDIVTIATAMAVFAVDHVARNLFVARDAS